MITIPTATQRIRGLLDAAGIDYARWNWHGETTHLYFNGWDSYWPWRLRDVPGLCVIGSQKIVMKGGRYLMVAVKVSG